MIHHCPLLTHTKYIFSPFWRKLQDISCVGWCCRIELNLLFIVSWSFWLLYNFFFFPFINSIRKLKISQKLYFRAIINLQNFKYWNKTPFNQGLSIQDKTSKRTYICLLKRWQILFMSKSYQFKTWILQMTMQTLQIPLNKYPLLKYVSASNFWFGHFTSKSSLVLLYCLDLIKIQRRVQSTSSTILFWTVCCFHSQFVGGNFLTLMVDIRKRVRYFIFLYQ